MLNPKTRHNSQENIVHQKRRFLVPALEIYDSGVDDAWHSISRCGAKHFEQTCLNRQTAVRATQ